MQSVMDDEVGTDPGLDLPPPAAPQPLAAIVIPARLHSERLPGKPLLRGTGKPLILHTVGQALQAKCAADVGVITDEHRIVDALRPVAGRILCHLSKAQARNGTHRLGPWLQKFDGWTTYDVVVNLQVDEPCIDPRDLDNLILAAHVTDHVATLVAPLAREQWQDPNAVKAFLRGDCVRDFSRTMLPEYTESTAWLHVGAYAFPQKWLKPCVKCEHSKRAKECSLEQLSWLSAGVKIHAVRLKHTEQPISVNTPREYAQFCKWWQSQVPHDAS